MKRSNRNGKLRRAAILFAVLIFAASAVAVTAFATEITPTPDPGVSSQSTYDNDGIVTVNPNVPPTTDPDTPEIPSDPNAGLPPDPNAPVTSPGEELPPDPNASIAPGESLPPEDTEIPSEGTDSSDVEISTPDDEDEGNNTDTPLASQKPTASVNTDNAQINQAASRAAPATSDPDLLSSQDWSELLTSGEVSQSPSAKPFEDNAQDLTNPLGNGEEAQGSASWILPAGIALIVLGLGGVAFFVYAQFFSARRPEDRLDNTGEFEEFLDINSDSSGLQQRGDYVPAGESAAGIPEEPGEEPVPEGSEATPDVPAEESAAPESASTEPPVIPEALAEEPPMPRRIEIAQPDVRFIKDAKTSAQVSQDDGSSSPYNFKVEIMEDKKDADGNFDWDSFFNDDK